MRIQIALREKTRCFLSTQASTKIYRNSVRRVCAQSLDASLEPEALFVLVPDVLQPFANGSYSQVQQFYLQRGASLVLVDWFSAGRAARGERWTFRRFESRNEVSIDGELVFIDSLLLDPSLGQMPLPMGRYNCVALVVLIGQEISEGMDKIVDAVSQLPVDHRASLIQSVGRIRDGIVLRIAGITVEEVSGKIRDHLKFVVPLLGDDPWQRKW